jgi:hypothetical protein
VEANSNELIQATFNPFAPEKYEKSIPLFIDDPELSKNVPYVDLVLKGEG